MCCSVFDLFLLFCVMVWGEVEILLAMVMSTKRKRKRMTERVFSYRVEMQSSSSLLFSSFFLGRIRFRFIFDLVFGLEVISVYFHSDLSFNFPCRLCIKAP